MNKLSLVLLFLLSACSSQRIIETDSAIKLAATEKVAGAHPNFNDKGTLYWYDDKTFDDALKKNNYIILEYGRKAWGNCRWFVEQVLPQHKGKLPGFIGVASDADAPNEKILKIIKDNVSGALTLPIIVLLDKSGKYVGGLWGKVTDEQFKELISKAK